ncbi:aconitate hydratase AcnA [uncultured Cohaesibacter sp.]|uniref:aconitate hydratase AcnA n=1 Tax=uncultured Cohaesibacter sp. TaxID=1002546 RepID=UPI002930F725|nr:aconitate hydratase AcnA [uncultured Cohaesibacter sp.]
MQMTPFQGTAFSIMDYAAVIGSGVPRLPISLRILAENVMRQDVGQLDAITGRMAHTVAFRPSRLILQDMLGLPLLVDMMAMKSRIEEAGGDPARVDMRLPVDMMVDHSMTVAHWASQSALALNQKREFEVNRERFAFIKACEEQFPNLRVVPPGGGIMHQVNLEYLGQVVSIDGQDSNLLIADTCLGTDSHTTMINGLSVLGWGIGGLEAEAIMFGEFTTVNVPRVIGLEVIGTRPDHITATDIALTIAEKLRNVGVVDCFVELFGSGYDQLDVADRATIANMSPEYGSTTLFCPCDDHTLRYLRETGRKPDHVALVEAYNKQQRFWFDPDNRSIDFDQVVTLDLGRIARSVAGPSKPEERITLEDVPSRLVDRDEMNKRRRVAVKAGEHDIGDGDVIIAAITSCTNTANPRNMITAGLIARNAVAKGMTIKPHVKTSLAPGSRVVAHYLEKAGLLRPLCQLGFDIVAFSCSTCNGMSGPLDPANEKAIVSQDIKGVAVLSGNRNFPGRIHPLASRNLIASPPLVIAYALAGTILLDIGTEPLGQDADGNLVMLDDLWPDQSELDAILAACILPEAYQANYQDISRINPHWNGLQPSSGSYQWAPSTYITFPPFIREIGEDRSPLPSLKGLRPLCLLGDSITTDHISPSGSIPKDSDAGQFLIAHGVEPRDFNSFGTRRGSSDIVIRSTFCNNRLKNEMVPDQEGSWTRLEPEGEIMTIFKAIETYQKRNQALIAVGGKEYGCGSSRDTAAKAPWLAGIRAVVAESFERIHRSNLVNMGIAPLCFPQGVSRLSLKLDGSELFDIALAEDLRSARMTIHRKDGSTDEVALDLRLYNDAEREIFRHGGLLPRFLRTCISEASS